MVDSIIVLESRLFSISFEKNKPRELNISICLTETKENIE